jgi:hypothetical protein
MITYRFLKEKINNGSYVKRPKINIELKGEKSKMTFFALLDSGTDVTIIPKTIADFLGIEYETAKKEPFFGFSKDPFESVETSVTVKLLGKERRQDITLQNIPALIALTGEEQEPVLGCKGIFEKLKITFINAERIQITKIQR